MKVNRYDLGNNQTMSKMLKIGKLNSLQKLSIGLHKEGYFNFLNIAATI